MTTLIVGRFDDVEDASKTLAALASEGFGSREYGLFYVTPPGQHDLYPTGGDAYSDQGASESGGGALKGAGVGSAAGLALGAIAAAAVPVAGIAAFVAATGVGAYVGSLLGALTKTREADESEATAERPVEQPGGLRVAVRVDEPETEHRAIAVLKRFGARDLGHAEGEWHSGNWVDFDPRVPPKPLQASR